MMDVTETLPIARYRFIARSERDLVLPDYAGSLLRGVFGAALRRLVCVTGGQRCSSCTLYRRCLYPAIFETPPRPTSLEQQFSQVPNPYIVEPPPFGTRVALKGQHLHFHMVLAGEPVIAQLPLLISAWQLAFRQGLGPQRVRLQLEQVQWCAQDQTVHDVWTADTNRVVAHRPSLKITTPPPDGATVRLNVTTPLRLQHQGKPLGPDALNVRTLLLAAMRRASLMLELHVGIRLSTGAQALLTLAEHMQDQREALRWCDWTRYSSRQRQEMVLGGVVGLWTLHAPTWSHAWPWLWLGQWLHLGKNATMGMGQYTVEVVPCF
ncbi:CRISPR system precrRNA processing endoribonuclease RAMP protein Cas6 [Tepidimonas sp.]|uniref:CRISPR system precrRNA processing endoribonuclease RAMP protein Cas6 n=1 Tax=Tepidimonas sp. TaxID=2002775 RepID=UPI00391D0839